MAFEVDGPIPFDEPGVLAGITVPLAAAGLGVFVVSTFDTDYVLVKEAGLDAACEAWRKAGVEVQAAPV